MSICDNFLFVFLPIGWTVIFRDKFLLQKQQYIMHTQYSVFLAKY